MLTEDQINQFMNDGFVKLEGAFSTELAKRCRDILWADTGCDPDDSSTWKEAVVWLWDYDQKPFVEAANTPALHEAFDQLVGEGRWEPRYSLGTFPVRFPAESDTGDTGWHVDASFAGPDADHNDFSSWRLNVYSRDRALLMLFLFSDVGPPDAPTRIRVGSHQEVARILAPAGDAGLSSLDLSATEQCEEVLATGQAGTVYLCHPFLVHAAQINRGVAPRFMAQPPLYLEEPYQLEGKAEGAYVPVEESIRRALDKSHV